MLFKMLWDFLRRIPMFLIVLIVSAIGFVTFNAPGLINNLRGISQNQESTNNGLFSLINLFANNNPTKEVAPTPTPWPQNITITIKTSTTTAIFKAEVADTPEKQQIGLMYRPLLGEYNGMFFVFSNDVNYPFWMKNVEFPLDMLFLDKDYKVVDIIKNVPQCKKVDATQTNCPYYTPKASYRNVIEISGGEADKLGIDQNTEIKVQ